VVAIGDVHGDLNGFLAALELGGAINKAGKWVGGDMRVVQTGDLVDRGLEEKEVRGLQSINQPIDQSINQPIDPSFFRILRPGWVGGQVFDVAMQLYTESAAAGGALHLLYGNHDFYAIQQVDVDLHRTSAVGWGGKRHAIFSSLDNAYGRFFAESFAPAVIIGRSLFVHGGMSAEFAPQLDFIFTAVKKHMLGDGPIPYDAVMHMTWDRSLHNHPRHPQELKAISLDLDRVLKILDIDRIVCGHSPRESGRLETTFGGRVCNIDLPLNQFMQIGLERLFLASEGGICSLNRWTADSTSCPVKASQRFKSKCWKSRSKTSHVCCRVSAKVTRVTMSRPF
jgi:hypothetical protein